MAVSEFTLANREVIDVFLCFLSILFEYNYQAIFVGASLYL